MPKILRKGKKRLIFNSYISPDSTPGDSLPSEIVGFLG